MKTRGVIPAIYLVIIGAVAVTQLVPNWQIWHWGIFQKKAPMAALVKAQDDLAKAKTDAAAKDAAYQSALSKAKADTLGQIGYSQETLAGVPVALAKAPQGPEVVLATALVKRAQGGLTAAIGDLPTTKQAEIEEIVNDALSAKQAQIDVANAKLASLDAQLATTTADKQRVEAQLPVLKQSLDTANATASAAQASVTAKTAEVVQYATNLKQKQDEAGGLTALVGNLWKTLIIFGIGYLIVHFVMPSLTAEFPASKILSVPYRWLTSIFSAHNITPAQPSTKTQ